MDKVLRRAARPVQSLFIDKLKTEQFCTNLSNAWGGSLRAEGLCLKFLREVK